MTDAERDPVHQLLPSPAKNGRPRKTDILKIADALYFEAATGFRRRNLSRESRPLATARNYFND